MNRVFLVLAGVAMSVSAGTISYALDADLRAVQSGELALVCMMKDGERVIDGSKVTGRIDGKWLFDNGHASNCVMIEKGVIYD